MALSVVSNRLPVTVRPGPAGIALTESVGGVATGLRGIQRDGGGMWIGWPGPTDHLSVEERAELDRLLLDRRCVAVHLTRAEVRGFYQGFCNGVIWPLFHYLTQQVPLHPRHWNDYERVNRRFAEAIAERWSPGDDVWIHDYQLLRVPLHLRRLRPEARIGFFLHIPFPSFEVFRILPARRLIVEGVLGADLIGFHTASYSEHFTRAVHALLGVPVLEAGHFDYEGRTPTVGVFPMGIDVARFEETVAASPFRSAESVKVLVGIDRLDYTKGIPRRLLAFDHMLERHPELREQVTLIQVAVPSRTGVKAYRRFRAHVDRLVGRINGRYGTAGWTPVQYLYRSFSQAELISLYRSADVMLVTPVRDGMNLVAKEFIASRLDADGVLVLSEFTGAAADLVEAVQVNPYDIEGTAEAYVRALTMPPHERQVRMQALRARVRAAPVSRWAGSFLEALHRVPVPGSPPAEALSPPSVVQAELDRVRAAPALLVLLDYDGTLVPYAPTPGQATPDEALLRLLAAVAARARTAVHIVSGRQRAVLEGWFGQLPLGLHAEHGAWSRLPQGREWERHEAVRPVPFDALLALLNHYTALTPGSLIERKSTGLAWHYRLAHPATGRQNAEALIADVRRRFAPDSLDLLRGEQIVEFRPSGVHKGLIVARLLSEAAAPVVVIAMGDDTTDEDMFAALPESGLSVHVGPRPSGARLRLRDSAACRAFLAELAGFHLG